MVILEKPMTCKEVALLLGVHVVTIRNWIKQGEIEATRLPGGKLRVPLSEVRRLAGVSVDDAE